MAFFRACAKGWAGRSPRWGEKLARVIRILPSPLLAIPLLGILMLGNGTRPALAQDTEAKVNSPGLILHLPPSAAARAWSLVGPDTKPRALPKEWIELLTSDPWSRPTTFTLWAKTVQATNIKGSQGQQARALLTLLSAAHRRPKSAWNHVASLSESPEWVAALVPRLIPGVPLATQIKNGGTPAPLIRGTRLSPIAPPRDPLVPAWAQAPRKAKVENLLFEDSAIDLEIDISGGGIELLLSLRSGPSTAVACSTPFMPGFRVNTEYLDFERQEPVGSVHLLVLTPEDEEARSLYSRLRKAELMIPTAPPADSPLSQNMRALGMVLVIDSEPSPRLLAAAQAFQELLQVPVDLAQASEVPHNGRKQIDLTDPTQSENLLRALCDSIEERVLQH